MIRVFELVTKRLITEYEIDTPVSQIAHDIDANGFKWVSMVQVADVFEIAVLEK